MQTAKISLRKKLTPCQSLLCWFVDNIWSTQILHLFLCSIMYCITSITPYTTVVQHLCLCLFASPGPKPPVLRVCRAEAVWEHWVRVATVLDLPHIGWHFYQQPWTGNVHLYVCFEALVFNSMYPNHHHPWALTRPMLFIHAGAGVSGGSGGHPD